MDEEEEEEGRKNNRRANAFGNIGTINVKKGHNRHKVETGKIGERKITKLKKQTKKHTKRINIT